MYEVSVDELDSLLKGLPENTKDTPYEIKITQITEAQCQGSNIEGTIGSILRNNYEKYISLSFVSLPENVTNATSIFSDCSSLISIDTSGFENITNAERMFYKCNSLSSVDTSGLVNVTDVDNMFRYCKALTSIDTSAFTNVTYARYMFYMCTSLKNIDTSAFTKVIYAGYMFYMCTSLKNIDTSAFTKVIYAGYMFQGCISLTSIDTSVFTNITDADNMFRYCEALTSIDTSAFTNVTNARYMFAACTSLTSIDTSVFTNVTNADNMFTACSSLTSIDTSAFTNVTNADNMFRYCEALTSIDTSAFTNVTSARYMFETCSSLTSIDTSAFTNVTNTVGMFRNCTSLTTIDTSGFIKVENVDDMFDNCTSLTTIDTSVFTNVTDADNMFDNCSSLTTIDNWGFNCSEITATDDMFRGTSKLQSIYKRSKVPSPYDGSDIQETVGDTEIEDFLRKGGCETNPTIYKSFDYSSITTPFIHLDTLLKQLPAVSEENPYKVEITEITKEQCGNSETENTVGFILKNNPQKFLNLSFTSLPQDLISTSHMFDSCSSLVAIDTSVFTNIDNAEYMFYMCTSLKNIDTSNFTNITNAYALFVGCPITSIDTSPFSKVTNAGGMFNSCGLLKEIDASNFINVTTAPAMFQESGIKNVINPNFSKLQDAFYMFNGCDFIETIDTKSFKEVTVAEEMFSQCEALTSIDVSAFKKVTNARSMFKNDRALISITGWNFDRACDVSRMLRETNPNLKVTIPCEIIELNKYSLVRLRTSDTKKTITYKSLTEGSQNITAEISSNVGDKISFYNKNDEICVSSEISDAVMNKMAEYRYPWSKNESTLDPSKKNFVLWADSESNIVSNVTGEGITGISKGGTGAKTEFGASYNLFKDIPESTGDIDENSQFQFHYLTPSETKGSFYYRKSGKVWEWIKGKADALYLGKTAKASSATTADSATNLKVSNHDTNNTTYYPIWANGKGDGSTARGTYTSTDLNYIPSTGDFKSKKFTVDKKVDLEWNSTTNSLDFKFL